MLQLVNLSVYTTPIGLYDGDWSAVADFAARQGFDGIDWSRAS